MPEEQFLQRVRTEVAVRLRSEIGRRLLLREARKDITDQHQAIIDAEVDKEKRRQIAMFGGSIDAWRETLSQRGLTEKQWRRRHEEMILVQHFIHTKILPQLTVTRQEILDYYNQVRQEQYVVEPQAHLQQIVLVRRDYPTAEEMLALARSLVARLRAGEDFGHIARKYSRGPKADDGGDWGMVGQGAHRVEAVNEFLFSAPLGTVSDPIVDGPFCHIIRVARRLEGRTKPFTEVQDECRAAIENAKRAALIDSYVDALRARNYVEVYEDAL